MRYREIERRLAELEQAEASRVERVRSRVVRQLTEAELTVFAGDVERWQHDCYAEYSPVEWVVLLRVDALIRADPESRSCDYANVPVTHAQPDAADVGQRELDALTARLAPPARPDPYAELRARRAELAQHPRYREGYFPPRPGVNWYGVGGDVCAAASVDVCPHRTCRACKEACHA